MIAKVRTIIHSNRRLTVRERQPGDKTAIVTVEGSLVSATKEGAPGKTKVMLLAFFDSEGIIHHEYIPEGKQLTRNSTWRSCNVCVNQFAENNQKNGGMATGSCTTTMHLHTLHILCSSFWPNTAPHSCSSCHTHQISHRVTFPIPKA